MNHESLISIHSIIRSEGLVAGCNLALSLSGDDKRVSTGKDAYAGLMGFLQGFLASDQKTEAALLLWGPSSIDVHDGLFDPRSRAVKLIWQGLSESNKTLIIGGGSQGKTVTTAAWIVLDWIEDPANTTTKIISTTAGHAKSNFMAKILRYHRDASFRLPGFPVASSGLQHGSDKSSSISQVAIPEGDNGKGRLTGFHPMPRTKEHSKFGVKTRVRAFIDEADTVPFGLWEGVDNMLGSEDDRGSVQVAALTNPRDVSSSFYSRAEPVGGRSVIDPDRDYRWISRDGWLVIRLDPAKSENVLQKKEVFPGMMTYQGFQNYVRKGKGSSDYWIMGRGWYPEQTAEFIVVSSQFFDRAVGLYTFTGDVTPIGSLDPAFAEGGDDPTFTAGKTGTAIAFTPSGGEKIVFPNPIKNVVQIEQQFDIRKSDDPAVMGKQVIETCSALGIRPEFFVADETGNALGLCGWLTSQFGSIMRIGWGSAATEQKIMAEDLKTAYERYDGISTEMYFAFAHWLQYGQVKFAPIFANYQTIVSEGSTRRYYFHRGLQKLEDKVSFKAHNEGKSPDRMDSAVMLLHLVRVRAAQNPLMIPNSEMAKKIRRGEIWSSVPFGVTDRLESYEI